MEFAYTAKDRNGKRVSAKARADSVSLLVSRLKSQDLLPLEIKEIKTKGDSGKNGRRKFNAPQKRFKLGDLVVFTRQLSSAVTSGLVLTEALETICDDLENRYMQAVIQGLLKSIRAGSSFSGALAKYPKAFPISYVAMIKAGEEGGSLSKTLMDLSKYLEDILKLNQKIKSAIYYPAFLVTFCLVIVSIIIFFIVPKFQMIYDQARIELPLFTKTVIGISRFALTNIHWLIIAAVACAFAFVLFLKNPKLRISFDYFKLRIFILGKIIQKALLARFCRTLAILLSGGVGLPVALPISCEVANNAYLRKVVQGIKDNVLAGASLSNAFKEQAVFPRMVVKMVQVGEKTGQLSDMLMRNAEYYERELEATINAYTSLIEPALIVFIGAVVSVVVVAFYLPIFKISQVIK